MTEKTTTPTLNVNTREISGKAVKSLRNQGQLPGVVYGHKKESTSIVLSAKEFEGLYAEAGHTTLVNLKIDGDRAHKVLIHDVQVHNTKKHPLHVDFYLVNMKEKLHTAIPLEFVGESSAIDIEGGTLMTIKDEVQVECLPDALVSSIEVDISILKSLDDMIHMSDLSVPEGMTILDDAEEVIASIAAPRSEEELAELDAPVEDGVPEVESETGVDESTEETDEDNKKKED